MSEALELGERFPPPDLAAWRAVIERDLKGAPFEKRLVAKTLEGIDLQPLYTEADGDVSDARSGMPGLGSRTRGGSPLSSTRGWTIAVDLSGEAPEAIAAAREDLAQGATGLNLSLPATAGESYDALLALLEGNASTSVFLDGGAQAEGDGAGVLALRHAAELVTACSLRGGAPRGSFAGDPLGHQARGSAFDLNEATAQLAGLLHLCADHPEVRGVEVRADVYHDQGAHDAQDLALGIASGIHYLRSLERLGLEPRQVAAEIGFTFAIGRDLFMGVSKLRAARRLWSRVLEECHVPDASAPLHARVAWRTYTAHDPMANVLRATHAAFAAVVGGADRITVPPHDIALSAPEPGSRRLARNLQLILQHESHLHRVMDPAGGSYYVESLTDQLAAQAWEIVQAVEGQGGMATALSSGWVAERLAETRERRDARIATRKEPIIGVSAFPDLSEPPRGIVPADPGRRRLAEPYEDLRARSDAVLASTGARPLVFLASMGALAVHNARTTWITNLLAAGGLEATGGADYETPEAAASACGASGAKVVVICSSDAVYAEAVPSLVPALRAAGAARVILAGRPSPAMEAVGLDGFLHLGVDVLASLRRLWEVVQ